MKTKEIKFEYEVERPTQVVMPNDDQWHAIQLTVTATAVQSDADESKAEIAEIEIRDPRGDEFPVTEREREAILAAAYNEAIGIWEARS